LTVVAKRLAVQHDVSLWDASNAGKNPGHEVRETLEINKEHEVEDDWAAIILGYLVLFVLCYRVYRLVRRFGWSILPFC